ncbi:MAG: hypothetical protein HC922_10915 [Leptolyngbyaceae cyanobacterium SM2_3_12]|nr:hypothetical protein [Leptolyngbyaceae cyanobacterium SM2_3_12]
MQLTIDLPDHTFQRLVHLAELTQQPLSELVIQSISGNLPPVVETAPPEVQADLLTMQALDADALRQIAKSQVSAAQQARHIALLEKNQAAELTAEEQQELQELTLQADQLMLKKAHACALLRWRGQPIRDLSQLAAS